MKMLFEKLQSEFLTDCFFLEGFEITLILLLKNDPISRPLL